MTDHWKDVKPWCDAGRFGWIASWDAVDAARAKDAAAHAAEVAAKDAEIADLRRRLSWFTTYPCHWTRGEIEYTTDCGQIAGPVSKVPDGTCNGCGRQIVVSVPA